MGFLCIGFCFYLFCGFGLVSMSILQNNSIVWFLMIGF